MIISFSNLYNGYFCRPAVCRVRKDKQYLTEYVPMSFSNETFKKIHDPIFNQEKEGSLFASAICKLILSMQIIWADIDLELLLWIISTFMIAFVKTKCQSEKKCKIRVTCPVHLSGYWWAIINHYPYTFSCKGKSPPCLCPVSTSPFIPFILAFLWLLCAFLLLSFWTKVRIY